MFNGHFSVLPEMEVTVHTQPRLAFLLYNVPPAIADGAAFL